MKTKLSITILFLLVIACNKNTLKKREINQELSKTTSIQDKIANLKDSKNNEIIVVAHRADWRHAPENSLQAIQNCINMGVDMVEIDVRETKDGELVLMHDITIDRTTTGQGLVKEWTLDSLKNLFLKDGLGVATPHKIPTLREALILTKDKILVNLDKSYAIFDKCYKIIQETGTQDQVIIKGAKHKSLVQDEFGEYLDKVLFMPVVNLDHPNATEMVNEYMEQDPPEAIEFTAKYDTLQGINRFREYREKGTSVWVNALWPQLNGGHDDEKAALDPSVYDWYIDHHIDIIQTDRPALLLNYLRSKGLHN
ncbi:glycerophosphodiester phosphodiesterase family protein [Aestuariivivens sediminis]|uniref:glycerophosphodiester phosphodiesterase family protein n=1 Tax=Aestuariivivens sediminis TaxID=2913557 RepID=UPI001F57A6A0|nr:glycerophosphodiester phosphodiesterase family protein [Aestuariivivens sediminis]